MNASNRKLPVASMLAVVIVGLGLLLCSWEAYAETLHRVSPKIAPRTRESGPVLSPFTTQPVKVSASAAVPTAKTQPSSRIEAEPSHEVPVSYRQPSGSTVENTESAPTDWPEKSSKTSSQTHKSNPGHPVVHPPEPLLPRSPQSAVPNPGEMQMGSVDYVAEMAMDQRAVAEDDSLLAQAATGSSMHEKPTVHFPEDLTPAPNGHNAPSAKVNDRNIYPISYQPYIGRITERRQQDLETAISHYNRAAYYEQRNKLDEAIGEYKQALLLHSDFADAYVGMSTAMIRKNDWENVMNSLQRALGMKQRFMDPSNIVQAWYNLSTAHCVADQYSPARRYYQKVKLAGHPNTQDLWEFIQKNCTP
jgi:hypothetical protein